MSDVSGQAGSYRTPRGRALAQNVRFGGFRPLLQLEPLVWLLLASSMRVLALTMPPAFLVANLAVLMAVITSTRRVVEALGGQTGLGRFGIGESWRLIGWTLRTLWPFGVGLLAIALLAPLFGVSNTKLVMAIGTGIDAIAFDCFTTEQRLVCAFTAMVAFLLAVAAGEGQEANLTTLSQLMQRHWPALLLAMGLVFAWTAVLTGVQEWVRPHAGAAIRAAGYRSAGGIGLFFLFVVGFAFVRLSVTIWLLALCLRRSQRAGR
jgi:hypothetical protein